MIPLKTPEKIIPYNSRLYTFIIIGCGGTGSYLVRDLSRIIGIYNKQYNRNDTMLLIDADVVRL
jgi:tRNA A37 threonylcarbamoyladenosine dehydratase